MIEEPRQRGFFFIPSVGVVCDPAWNVLLGELYLLSYTITK